MSTKEVETFIGPCSKFVSGQGWTTEIPVEQLSAKGYHKDIAETLKQKEKDTAKEILQGFTKWLNQAIRESYNQSVNGVVFQGGKNRAFHEVKELVKKVAESKGVEVE